MTQNTTITARNEQLDTPNAVFPPFKRGRTGRKGVSKYIQIETGSWVTFNPDGSCHIGARHKYLGNLLEVAGELEQRKEYADAWRVNMQKAEREYEALKADFRDLQKRMLPKDREIAKLTAQVVLLKQLRAKQEPLHCPSRNQGQGD